MKYAHITAEPNKLYYGDCLDVMSKFPENYIDLICLDPPFNSNEKYSSIFKGSGMNIEPQVKAFDDTWTWNDTAAERVENVKSASFNPARKVIAAFETFIPHSKMLAYTSYMAERLFQMWHILKDTGSIYLHCDPYASHYLKLIMDAIFGQKNFRNEIVWCYTGPGGRNPRQFNRQHQTLFWYSKGTEWTFNKEEIGIPYKGGAPHGGSGWNREGETLEEWRKRKAKEGKNPETWWQIPKVNKPKYPTEKPIPLYDRIIKASSNPDDIVLDPFCGCGTTIVAAKQNGRRVIGIDILPFALDVVNNESLKLAGLSPLPVEGIPVDIKTAEQLAETDKRGVKFQDWAISLVDGLASNPQKVGDEGADGFGMFAYKPTNMDKKGIIVQVTAASGSQNAKFDKLQNDVRKHNAAMGILITKDEQIARHRWHVNLPRIQMGDTFYEPMQCLSIAEYYRNGKRYSPSVKFTTVDEPMDR